MNAPTITVDKKIADAKYREYVQLCKLKDDLHLDTMRKAYLHIRRGHAIIDLYEVLKAGGVNEQGDPRLAISVASARTVHFQKREGGAGRYNATDNWWRPKKADIIPCLPGTFPEWPVNDKNNIIRRDIEARVPTIPANLFPKGPLNKYYILWDVASWTEVVPRLNDPFLLVRLNDNTFAVLGEWDVTPLEQAVIRGR